MTDVRELMQALKAAAPDIRSAGRDRADGERAGIRPDNSAPTPDVLASAIAEVARHHGRNAAVAGLVSGLPLVDGRLPLEHAGDAARRAGLIAERVDAPLDHLEDAELPVIVLGGESADVLWRIERGPDRRPLQAVVGVPGQSGQRIAIPFAELGAAYSGCFLRLRPSSGLDERGHSAVRGREEGWFLPAFTVSRRIYAEAIAATVAVNVLALAMPLFSMNIYDRVLPNAAVDTLWALAIGVLLATVFDFVIRTLRALFVDAASRRADVVLANFIYGRVLGARIALQPASAGVRANTLREFETLREFFNSATLTAFGDLPFVVLFLVVLAIIAGPLALIAAAAIPLVLGLGWLTHRALQRLTERGFKETAQKNAIVVETLVGLETIKAAGAESWAAAHWERAVADHVRTGVAIRHLSNLGMHVVQAAQTAVQVAVIIAGFYMVSAGQITMGALIASTILAGRALAPLGQIAMLLSRLNQAQMAYAALSEMVAAPQEKPEGAAFLSGIDTKGAIVFENVTFGYEADAAPALRDVSFEIKPGERVGIIGGIGSGKTSLLKLVHVMATPQRGRILLDGVAIGQIDPAVLRRKVGLLLQSADLFHGTIGSNITLGDPSATDEQMIAAADAAGALDWISRLPKGFDTPLRERGSGLSGGQRQSVALARALLQSPRVVLLDEPTSDMDGRTEQTVIRRLQRFCAGRTLIVVTHRPALLDLVDRMIVLEQGKKLLDGPKTDVLQALQAITERQGSTAAAVPPSANRPAQSSGQGQRS